MIALTLIRRYSSVWHHRRCSHRLRFQQRGIHSTKDQLYSWTGQWFWCFNSLATGRSECDSKNVIFNLVLLIGIFRSSHDNALWWMPQDLTDDKSTLVQVMAWCRQATSHYLSQCWPRSLSPYGITRPQWVNVLTHWPLRDIAVILKLWFSNLL